MPKISIIIPVHNRWNFTSSCINSLLELNKEDNEIIIIDNASTDDTKLKIQELLNNNSNIKYIRNEENIFHSAACNQGYAIALSENIIFLNNDIRIKGNIKDWTNHIAQTLDANDNAIMGPVGGAVDPKGFNFLYETRDATKIVNYISGWCIFGKKNTFDKLKTNDFAGPWSNDFPFYFNDTDLSFRAKQIGINLKLFDIPLAHFGGASSNQFSISKLYNEGKHIFTKKWKNIK